MRFSLFHIAALLPLAYAAAIPNAATSLNPRSPLLARQTCGQGYVHSGQWATYYTSGTSPTQTTACGTHYDVNNWSAAISVELENKLGGMSKACQRQIMVINEATGQGYQLVILDANATGDLGEYALDLSPAAYNALGGNTNDPNDPGQMSITWYLVMGVDTCF